MPTYVCHGFRWPRPLIRVHVVLNNIDDAAPEWLIGPATSAALLDSFRTLHPAIMPQLAGLTFLEQHDPLDLSQAAVSQPYAYVCDVVREVKLGVDVDEVRGKGVSSDGWNAIMELRDAIAPGEKVAWFVVVCGDTERLAPSTGAALLEDSEAGVGSNGMVEDASGSDEQRPAASKSGFRKWFGKKELRNSKSFKELPPTPTTTIATRSSHGSPPPPPVPGTAV